MAPSLRALNPLFPLRQHSLVRTTYISYPLGSVAEHLKQWAGNSQNFWGSSQRDSRNCKLLLETVDHCVTHQHLYRHLLYKFPRINKSLSFKSHYTKTNCLKELKPATMVVERIYEILFLFLATIFTFFHRIFTIVILHRYIYHIFLFDVYYSSLHVYIVRLYFCLFIPHYSSTCIPW